jgi:two-component system response regulator FixJ
MNKEPTVFIVDDDNEVREAIALLMESVGLASETYDSAWAYLACFDPKRAGCLVLDVRMRHMSGLELQERLAEEPMHPPVIIITGHGDVPMAVRAVKNGAVDFIEKPFNDQSLLDAVHRAIEIDAEQRGHALEVADIQQRLERLTKREREVLDQIIAGKRNKVIAADLGISQSTVEAHRAKVMEKLEARSLSELMRLMLLIDPGNAKTKETPPG